MLSRKRLIENIGEEYTDMVSKISIPDFTKCIAQYSGIRIQDLKDEIVLEYLSLWAKNKKRFYDLMGGNIKVDLPISFLDEDKDYKSKIIAIGREYPAYYLWCELFENSSNNKINGRDLPYTKRSLIDDLFPGYNYEGTSITRFFKSKLNAPDELVTAIGRVWENSRIEANFAISIDPVDIMLSSENPYNWTSCYRLEHFQESHADGCLAGVLDGSTIITYVWKQEGKFSLYDEYDFKKIRYKMMRMTIALNEDCNAIHFNQIYPGKNDYSETLKKMFRDKVETWVAEVTHKTNMWVHNEDRNFRASRIYDQYGYNEYDWDYIYLLKEDFDGKGYGEFQIYSKPITCPCGCGEQYIGSDNDSDYMEYNSDGHTNDNWYEEENEDYYCNYEEEYVDCSGECGPDCPTWCRHNMVCQLDDSEHCDRDPYDAEYDGDFDPWNGNVVNCNPEHCNNCPLFKLHHPNEENTSEIRLVDNSQIGVISGITYVDNNDVSYTMNI